MARQAVNLEEGQTVRFHERVFAAPWAPHYDAYAGHRFQITALRYARSHAQLVCLSDPQIQVQGLVHWEDLLPDGPTREVPGAWVQVLPDTVQVYSTHFLDHMRYPRFRERNGKQEPVIHASTGTAQPPSCYAAWSDLVSLAQQTLAAQRRIAHLEAAVREAQGFLKNNEAEEAARTLAAVRFEKPHE